MYLFGEALLWVPGETPTVATVGCSPLLLASGLSNSEPHSSALQLE